MQTRPCVHGTLQRTDFRRVASHFADFITYVSYVLVSNVALKALRTPRQLVNVYIMHASACIMLPVLETHVCQLPLRTWLQQ